MKNLSSTKFLLQPIWNNVLFTYKDKTLFFQNWVKSNILYVKDIFKDDGTLKTLNDHQDILLNKSNLLCEYGVLFRVFKKYTRKFDCSNIDYTNPMPTVSYLFSNGFHSVLDKNCKFYYENLLQSKFHKPNHQSSIARHFALQNIVWQDVYEAKIVNMLDENLSEFNYKLLNNILCCNLYLSKWKHERSMMCDFCETSVENIEHLIYECKNIHTLWQKLSIVLDFEIK